MDYRIIGYVAFGLLAIYLAIRFIGKYAFRKLVRAEFEHVLNSEEHKVKGRFQ